MASSGCGVLKMGLRVRFTVFVQLFPFEEPTLHQQTKNPHCIKDSPNKKKQRFTANTRLYSLVRKQKALPIFGISDFEHAQ